MSLSRIERKQTLNALARCGWTRSDYDARDIDAGRTRERELIESANREAERIHSLRIARLIDIDAARVAEHAAWRAKTRERMG